MDSQPVTLQGRDERADIARHPRYQRGHGNGDDSKRGGNDTDGPLVISDIHDQIYQDDGPGEKDKGFVHIGEGYISVPRGVRLPPPDQEACQVDEKTDKDNPESNPAYSLLFCHHKQEIEDKRDEIHKHGDGKKIRIIHGVSSSVFRDY